MAQTLRSSIKGALNRSIKGGLLSPAQFRGSTLDLDFAGAKSLKNQIGKKDVVSFTRASSGTYVGSDGLIKTATTNLLLQSEDFSTSWSSTRATISTNTETAPNGTSTADKLIEDNSVSSTHLMVQGFTYASGTTYTISFFAKAAERDQFQIRASTQATFPGDAIFNLATGTTVTLNGTSSITPIGDGWYRCSVTAVAAANGTTGTGIYLRDGGSISYTGDGTSGIYVWGAQLEQSDTVGEYVKTTSTINSAPRFDHDPTTGESLGLLMEESRTNLLLRSEEFDSGSWTSLGLLGFGSGSTANAITAPDGTLSADLITEDTSTAAQHAIFQIITVSSGATVTFSVYLKAGARTFARLIVYQEGTFSNNFSRFYDLSTGSIGSSLTGGTGVQNNADITPLGDGWYRCEITGSVPAATSYQVRINIANSIATTSYTGDGTSGIYLWGAQLE